MFVGCIIGDPVFRGMLYVNNINEMKLVKDITIGSNVKCYHWLLNFTVHVLLKNQQGFTC